MRRKKTRPRKLDDYLKKLKDKKKEENINPELPTEDSMDQIQQAQKEFKKKFRRTLFKKRKDYFRPKLKHLRVKVEKKKKFGLFQNEALKDYKEFRCFKINNISTKRNNKKFFESDEEEEEIPNRTKGKKNHFYIKNPTKRSLTQENVKFETKSPKDEKFDCERAKLRYMNSIGKLDDIANDFNTRNNCIDVAVRQRRNYMDNKAASFNLLQSRKSFNLSKISEHPRSHGKSFKKSKFAGRKGKSRGSLMRGDKSSKKISFFHPHTNMARKSESSLFITHRSSKRSQSEKNTPSARRFEVKKKFENVEDEMSLRDVKTPEKSLKNTMSLLVPRNNSARRTAKKLKRGKSKKIVHYKDTEEYKKKVEERKREKILNKKINDMMVTRYGKKKKLNFNIQSNFQPWKKNKRKSSPVDKRKFGEKKVRFNQSEEERSKMERVSKDTKNIKKKMKDIEHMLNGGSKTFEVFALGNGNRPEFSHLGNIHKRLHADETERKLVKYTDKKGFNPMSSVDLWGKDFFLDVMEEGKFLQQKRKIENYRDLDKKLKYIHYT